MANISKIKDILGSLQHTSPSGFAIAFHIRLTSPEFLFQTYPKEWTDIYSEKGYVMVDPIVRWGFSNNGSVRWSELANMDSENILEQSLAYDMAYGVAIGIEAGGTRSVAGFAHPDREFSDEEITSLIERVQDLHALTAGKEGMEDAVREQLQSLSVQMTRPHNP